MLAHTDNDKDYKNFSNMKHSGFILNILNVGMSQDEINLQFSFTHFSELKSGDTFTPLSWHTAVLDVLCFVLWQREAWWYVDDEV